MSNTQTIKNIIAGIIVTLLATALFTIFGTGVGKAYVQEVLDQKYGTQQSVENTDTVENPESQAPPTGFMP